MEEILQDIKVLDLTSVVMGPYCTSHLADLGADVIKIESPNGDSTRYLGPSKTEGMSSIHLHLNRNKKSVIINLKTREGQKKIFSLIENADVFVHSLRPHTIEKLGLSYEEVKKKNTSIIYCGMYGYSEKGPYKDKPAYDDIIQAASGIAATQGEMTGKPQYLSTLMGDKTAGIIGVSAILAALFYRERTGVGQKIEVPMFETLVSFNMVEHLYGKTFFPPIDDIYYPRAVSRYRKPYQTKDGYISIMIYNDKHWNAFFDITGRNDLKNDIRFSSIYHRTKNIDFVYKTIEGIVKTKTTEEWQNILRSSDIPFSKVNTPSDLFNDEHLQEIEFFKKIHHHTEGDIIQVKYPINFSETPVTKYKPAPKLGEHNEELIN